MENSCVPIISAHPQEFLIAHSECEATGLIFDRIAFIHLASECVPDAAILGTLLVAARRVNILCNGYLGKLLLHVN